MIEIQKPETCRKSFQMTATWNEMVTLRHFDISNAVCNALLLHKSRKQKNSFFKCHNRLQIHLFSCEYFSLFSPYFPFSHLSMVVLHKVEDGRAFLYYCNSFAMQLAHVSSYTKGQEISEEFFSCLVQKSNEKFTNFCLSL